MKKATLLYAPTAVGMTNFSSDLLWRTRFKAFDPFFFIDIGGKTTIIISSLEVGRAVRANAADEVISFKDLPPSKDKKVDPILTFLKKKGVTHVVVPSNFDYDFGKTLESKFRVEVKPEPFFTERQRKTEQEIHEIKKAQSATERSLKRALAFLEDCEIKGGGIYKGMCVVTSETMIRMVEDDLYQQGYLAVDTIFACGAQAADPHEYGTGPLKPHLPIVIDIFPFSLETHYYADMTRTIFLGEPSRDLKLMYKAVYTTQKECLGRIKSGVRSSAVNKAAVKTVESLGFDTEPHKGSGFIHGIGHGVGMEIHEPPTISSSSRDVLKRGHVVTVEPGLYYPKGYGDVPPCGMRIEDLVVVGDDDCLNLTQFPKDLDSVIIRTS